MNEIIIKQAEIIKNRIDKNSLGEFKKNPILCYLGCKTKLKIFSKMVGLYIIYKDGKFNLYRKGKFVKEL